MRGKEKACTYILTLQGITPAYAGKSDEAFYQTDDIWDHPRLCGEKLYPALIADSVPGSPPPMRGKEYGLNPQKGGVRITPAYAGKSNCQKHGLQMHKDHPRLCGEKSVT